MSEIRQRKGDNIEKKVSDLQVAMQKAIKEQDFDEAKRCKEEIQKLGHSTVKGVDEKKKEQEINLLETLQKNFEETRGVPGLTNETQAHKNALSKDPYNLMCIYNLGCAYASEKKWEQCVNTLIRGWKRVSEFEDPQTRVEFLRILCTGSYNLKKDKQALAVISDIDDCDVDNQGRKELESLKCKIYCANQDLTRALKAFNNAIEGEAFNEAVEVWSGCSLELKRCGGFAVTKEVIEKLAKTDADRKRIDALEKLGDLMQAAIGAAEEGKKWNFMSMMQRFFIGFIVAVFVYYLYHLESRSLTSMKAKAEPGYPA